eukprot:5734930-Amphidinium_carterae.1
MNRGGMTALAFCFFFVSSPIVWATVGKLLQGLDGNGTHVGCGSMPEEKNQTFGGDKPIHMAVRRQDMRAVEMLLEHSAQATPQERITS